MSDARELFTIDDLRQWPGDSPLRLAVVGDPVAHSASPPMHNAALADLGMDARYTRLHIRPEELPEAFALLPGSRFLGVNCTIPHKPQALKLVHTVDESARRAGGVNTVVVGPDGMLTGHSTDGGGFSRAVREAFGILPGASRVAVLGAGGGAGRAIAMQCAFEGSSRILLVNRTLDKIASLATDIAEAFPRVRIEASDFESLTSLAEYDLIVNCTSLGMKREDASPLASDLILDRHFVYDTIYTAARTPLMLAADVVGARSENGLPMLLHQGVLSFEIWFHREPPIEKMRAALLAVAPR